MNGISITIKSRNENDESIRIIAVLRDENGTALEIKNKEVTVASGNSTEDISFKNNLNDNMTVDYFITKIDYSPLSLKHTL